MKFKKLFAGLISLAAALLAVCAITVCAGAETSGDYKYSILDDGTVEITDYTGSATNLTIPATIGGKKVTSIGYGAFYRCTSITSVKVPDGVKSIGDGAFEDCSSLKSIDIPDSITSIGSDAFYETPFLGNQTTTVKYAGKWAVDCYGDATTATIKSGTVGIAGSAFSYSSYLTSIIIPDSVTIIGNDAFNDCRNLTSINIPDGVTSIGDSTFSGCQSLTSIIIPDGVTSIGDSTFSACKNLTSITIPDSVRSIGAVAFWGCSSLKSIDIPDGVRSIGMEAFKSCKNLSSIKISNSVTSIGRDAFSDTLMLNSQTDTIKYADKWVIGCDDNASKVTIKSGTIGIADYAFTEHNRLGSVSLPDGIKYIGNSAFYNCVWFTTINIPDSMINIGDYAFDHCSRLTTINIPDSLTSIGRCAFYYCQNLTSITVDNNNPKFASKDGVLFNKDMTTLIVCPGGKEGNYIIPGSVTNIGDNAFLGCCLFTSITIPDSVTSIGVDAFQGCRSLTSIIIPKSVTNIESGAFNNCQSLTSITILGNLTSIEHFTFAVCFSITSINIPESVKSIGYSAFDECTSLTSITIPDSVTNIGYYAFNGCTSLTSITVPDSVTNIGYRAFYNTPFLDNQTTTVKYAGKCVIDCDEDATSVTIKSGTLGIAENAFDDCSNLTSITIPNSVKSIGHFAFVDCSNLTKLTIPDTVKFIGKNAFEYCSNLKDIYYTGSKAQWDKISIDEVNEELLSATIHYNYNPNAPSSVTGLKLKGRAGDALRISWTKNAGADGYIIERKDGSQWVRVAKITKNSTTEYRIDKLKAGTAYNFRIRAYKMDGKTALYSGYTTISARTNPSAVTGLKLKGRSGDALRISWTKNTSADGYIIEMKSGSTWTRIGKVTKNSTVEFRKDKLKAGTAYSFRVKAYKMSGKTALYSGYTTISARTNPSAVSGLKLKAATSTAVRLAWSKNTSADGYIIEMKSGNSWVRVGKVTKNSTVEFRKGSLKSKTSYTFRIKAYKMSGKTALYSGYTTITVKTK